MSRNLTPEPVATGSAETRIGQLRWREYGDPREAAGDKTLLFVHGLLTNSDVWGEVVQNLSQDFRCITLDIPLGSHTIPAHEDAALTVAALAQAVNEAAEQLCPHGFTLIGSDTGGVVSQLAAVQEPACRMRTWFPCRKATHSASWISPNLWRTPYGKNWLGNPSPPPPRILHRNFLTGEPYALVRP